MVSRYMPSSVTFAEKVHYCMNNPCQMSQAGIFNENETVMSFDDDSQPRRNRMLLLCDRCRKRKVKCDRKMPCLSCVRNKKADECDYSGDTMLQTPNSDFSNNINIFRMSTGEAADGASSTESKAKKPPKVANAAAALNGQQLHKWKDQPQPSPQTVQSTSSAQTYSGSDSVTSGGSAVFSEIEMLKLKVQQLEASLQNSRSNALQLSFLNGSGAYLPETGVTHQQGTDVWQLHTPGAAAQDETYIGVNPYDMQNPDEELDLYDAYNPIHTRHNRQMNYGPYSWLTVMKKDEALTQIARFIKFNAKRLEKASLPVVPKDTTTAKRGLIEEDGDHEEKFRQKALTRDGDADQAPITQQIATINDMKVKMNQKTLALGLTFFEGEVDQKMHLIEKIRIMLPTKMSVWVLVNRFFVSMYPFLPFIDENWFRAEIKRLLGPEAYTEDKYLTIRVEKRLDFAVLGLLLIVLRLSYLSSFSNNKAENERVLACRSDLPLAETKYILTHPIDMDVIDLAEVCLDQFDLFRRTNLVVLQCAVFMRVYHMFAPEEGDGSDGGDAQVYNSLCIQMAVSMGLNREPDLLEGYDCDDKQKNLGRKIWHFLKMKDMNQSFQYGFPLLIDDNYYDTCVPYYHPGNTNLVDSNMEKAICEMLAGSHDILQDVRHILKLSLGIKQKVKMSEITQLVSDLEIKLKTRLGTLSDFFNGSMEPGPYPFQKVMACKAYMNYKSFLLTLFFHFFLNYERLGRTELAFFYLRKVWAISCGEFLPKILQLITDNRVNFDPKSTAPDLVLSPSIEFLIHKTNQMNFSILIRVTYTIYNMKKDRELHNKNLLSSFEYKLRYGRLCKLAKILEKFCRYATSCLSRLSSRYYYAWRVLKAQRYFIDVLEDSAFGIYVASEEHNFISLDSEQLNDILAVADSTMWLIKSSLKRSSMFGDNLGFTPGPDSVDPVFADNASPEEYMATKRPHMDITSLENKATEERSPVSSLSFDFEDFALENNGQIDEIWQQLTDINNRIEAESHPDLSVSQSGYRKARDGWIPLYLNNVPYQPFYPTSGFDLDNMFDLLNQNQSQE